MLNGINTQLLKVFAETSGIPLNPAVLGIGGALTTGAGIYKMMKDARKNNEEAIQEDTKFKEYQKFLPNAKLISYYTPYIKSLLRSINPAVVTVNLLAGLLSVQAKLLEHTLTPVKKDIDILEKKNDDRSIGQKIKGVLHKANFLANPFAQLFTYVFQGLTPSAVAKIYGFDDKKEYKEQMKKAEERSTNLGVNLVYAQLLGMTGSQLLRNKGRDGLMAGIFDMSKMISETLLIIKLKGFGIGKSVKVGEADEKSSFLGKMMRGILNIPGVNAVKNVAKVGMNIALSPFKLYAKMGEIADKIPRAFKNFMSGGLYKAQDEETLMKNAGFTATKFIDSRAFPSTLNLIAQHTQQTSELLFILTDAYTKKNNMQVDLNKVRGIKAKIYSKFTGRNVTKEQYADQRYEMYSRNFDGIVGNLNKLWLGWKTKNKTAEEYMNLEREMVAKKFGKVIGETDTDKVKERMAKWRPKLAGESNITKVLSDEEVRKSHQTGQTKVIGAVGAVKTFGKFGLGLASGLATGGIGGILSALFGPYYGVDNVISGIRTGRKEGWKKGIKAAFKGEDKMLGGGLIGSAISGSDLEKQYRGSEKDYLKYRLAKEGGESIGGSQTNQTLQDVASLGPSEDILLLRDLNTKIENMHRGVSGVSNLNATMTSLYKLIDTTIVSSIKDLNTKIENMHRGVSGVSNLNATMTNVYNLMNTTINDVKSGLTTLRDKFKELVEKFKKTFMDPVSSNTSSGNIIDILKYYSEESHKNMIDLKKIEEQERDALVKLSGFADSYSIAHAAASGGPATVKMKPESRIVPGKPPIDKNVDNVISINSNKTFQPLQSGEIIQTQEQFQNYNKAIENLSNSKDNLYFLQNKYIEQFQQISSSNENVLKVLQEIRDNTKPDPTDTNRIVETIRNSQPDQEEEKLNKIEETSRWNKLIGLTEETKDTIRGKISYFLRDMWEETKFKKKKKEEDKSSGLFGLLGGLLAPLGGLLAKMFLGNKLINNPITRMFGSSLWLIVKDFFKLLKWSAEGVWKLISKPIKATGGWLIDKFKKHITTPIKNMFSKVGEFVSEKFSKYIATPLKGVLSEMKEHFVKNAIDPIKRMFGKIGGFFKGEGTSFLSKMFGKIFGEHGILKSIGSFFKGEGTSTLSKMFGKIFGGEGGGFIGKMFGKIFGGEGILKGVGKIFGKIGIKGILKGIGKYIPGINLLFSGWDAFSAWKDADKITGDPKPSFMKKLGAGIAGIVSGLTFGLIEPKTIYDFMSPAINMVSGAVSSIGNWLMNTKPVKMVKEFLGYTEKDPNPEKSFLSRAWDKIKEISKDSWNYLCGVPYLGAPLRLINDVWNFLFEPKQNAEGEFEPSFISKMWSKLKEIPGDVFNYMKTVPIIGTPFRLLSDAYDYLFGEKDPDKEPTFVSQVFDGFKSIAKNVFEFMKTVPIIGTPFRLLDSAYHFFFDKKDKSPQKTIFDKMIEFFDSISLDSLLSAIIGPSYLAMKRLYNNMMGENKSYARDLHRPKKGMVTRAVEAVSGAYNSAERAVVSTYDKTVDAVKSIIPSAEPTSFSGVDKGKFNDALEMPKKGLGTRAVEVVSGAYDKTKSTISSAYDKTKGFISNLIGGSDTSKFKPLTDDELKKDTVKIGSENVATVVYKAIKQASDKYGIPLDYMLAKAYIESKFNPNQPNLTGSSALGLYQFMPGTWADMWKKVSPMPDRRDPNASADAGARYALETKKAVGTDDPGALYLGHFLGTGGVKSLFKYLNTDPNKLASSIMTKRNGKIESLFGETFFKQNPQLSPNSTVIDIYNWGRNLIDKFIKKINGKASSIVENKKTSENKNPTIPSSPPIQQKEVSSKYKDELSSTPSNPTIPSTPPSTSTETSNPTVPSTPTETSNPTVPSTPSVVASSSSVPALTQSQMMAQKFPSTQSMTPATPPITKSDIKSKYKDELSSTETPKQNRSSQEVAPVGNLNIQKDIKELQTNKMTTAEEERKIIVNIPPQQQQSPTLLNVNNPTNVIGGQKQLSAQAPIDHAANALIDKLFSSTIFAFTDSLGKKFVGNELTTSLAY